MSEWFDVKEQLPANGCLVIVDGNEFPTCMIARFDPSNKAYPWVVPYGYESGSFSFDSFDKWHPILSINRK